MRHDEPIVIFLRTRADGTRSALAIGQQTGTFYVSDDGWRTYSALLEHVAQRITEPREERIVLMPGDVP